jgi:hypothetical protein
MRLIKIISSNWIHLLGFYITCYFYGVLAKLIGLDDTFEDWSTTIFFNLIGIFLLLFTYGLVIILGFYITILLLDLLLFQFKGLQLIQIVLIEWVIIVPIFIYWAFKEDYWLWLALVASLLGTQLIRRRKLMTKYPELLP